jgi:4'-phosphopantetheinyl transferase
MSRDSLWQPDEDGLTFPTDRIDVWRIRIDESEPPIQTLRSLLASDEKIRADRYHFERDRGRYIRGRAALRTLLGRYLDVSPAEVRFRYGNNRKPELAFPLDSRDLRFNVSNSGELALIAVGSRMALGVDLEKIRPMPDLMSVAKRFFSAREVQTILTLDESKRQDAFFACWTRKEAFLKVTGVGLSYPLAGFAVSTDPDGLAELYEVNGQFHEANNWLLMDIFPGEGFRGALACEGKGFRVACRDFAPGFVERIAKPS